MARSGIPNGITREDVLEAISALKAHTVVHHFYESERYDLIHEGERLHCGFVRWFQQSSVFWLLAPALLFFALETGIAFTNF